MSEEPKKTKKQIEAEYPLFKPEDFPGRIFDWIKKRDEIRDELEIDRDNALVELIEKTIDKLFEKHFKKYVTMIYNNRLLIVLFAILLGVLWGVVLYQIYWKVM